MTTTSRSEPLKATHSEYVLPAAPRARPELVVAPATALPGWALAHESVAVRGFGERMRELLDCQTRFHGELRTLLGELNADIPEATRAHLLGQVRVLGEILDWCGAVHQDLLVEANRAAAGQRPIDVIDFARTVAEEWAVANAMSVAVHGSCQQPWWGAAVALADVVGLALTLVAERIGRAGTIVLEAADSGGRHTLRILGLGEPRELGGTDPVERLRSSVKTLGAQVTPDGLGPAGTGLVVHLPVADCPLASTASTA